MKDEVTLNRKEQARLMVLNEMEKGKVKGREAAGILGLSLRQVRRLIAAYRLKGARALAHGNRGRLPVNMHDDALRKRILELASGKYAGVNHQHFTDLLAEREGICLSRASVRRILIGGGIKSPRKRRPPKHRSRRERYPQEGMLLQIDGSPHNWLGSRGPKLCLIGAIDDATGKVPFATFREQEDSHGYFILLREIVTRCGIPLAIYHDRHSIFVPPADELKRETIQEQLDGKSKLTQFGRLMKELEITSISALSPQAKGRIERLWNTFQDRLVSELRISGISTREEANHFLESFLKRYNAKFAVPPGQEGSSFRPAKSLEMEKLFCFKYCRVVSIDNVVRFKAQRIQILPSLKRLSHARCSIEVHEQIDGSLKICYQGQYLDTRPAPVEATTARQPVMNGANTSSQPPRLGIPSPSHPWRQWDYRSKNLVGDKIA
jgi:transposase